MAEFLLEVGCEELPASFVEKAYTDLATTLSSQLNELGVLDSEPVTYGTPRRLIVSFPSLKDRQEDSVKVQRGPSLSAAFDVNGEPTKALLGFCKSQGVEVGELRKDDQYVWVTKNIAGRPTNELLAELLPKTILGLQFEKSMRWGVANTRFARPIRWVLAAFGGQKVEFQLEDVHSALISYGHRFYAPDSFEAKTLDALLKSLRDRFVEPDPSLRKEKILKETHAVASGQPEIHEGLLDENTFLCEWPTAISGTFPESYLELPEPVLVTAMAKHERMFPIRDTNGKLTNQFVFIRNSGDDETVRRGCEWVLGARFNDARFFYEQDQKLKLADFVAKTQGVVFQAQLGSVFQRIERLAGLSEVVAKMTGANSEESEYARLAGSLAKADLSTGLVSELSSLQGVIGAEYAKREGVVQPVTYAIARQYNLADASATTVEGRTAIRLCIADQLDKLAGYLGLGLEPTGSSDPFGLRRSVTILIDCANRWTGFIPPYDQLLEQAFAEYRKQGHDLNESGAYAALMDIFSGRYPALFDGFSKDILEAAMLREMRWELTMPRSVKFRANVLKELVQDENFLQTATRPINIVSAAKKKGIEYGWEDPLSIVDDSKLASSEGSALLAKLRAQEETVFKAAREENTGELLDSLKSLVSPLNAFFDNTMVMSEDAEERYHRLTLAHAAALQLLSAGDFTKIGG